jgi:heterodisulfide reductase subunit C
MDKLDLQHIIYQTRHGKKILNCIQCGTCSASCPFAEYMDHAPRELFALIRDGEMEMVLRSNTPWYCVSCYQCMVRCPQEIAVTDVMYFLKQQAIDQDLVPSSHKLPDFYHVFAKEIKRHGRITGSMLIAKYGARHPGDILPRLSLGFNLLKRRRFEFRPQKLKHPETIFNLLEGVEWNNKK